MKKNNYLSEVFKMQERLSEFCFQTENKYLNIFFVPLDRWRLLVH
jgi:hypothetical protein